jgi:WD40 repeat protein
LESQKTMKIFISSPSDVRPERLIAEKVVERLDREFAYHCKIEPVLWERKPLVATKHFQEDIPLPSSSDIVVVIVWTRLGTPLPSPRFFGAVTGSRVTGTEWEFEEAYKASSERGTPDLLVYRKTAPSLASLRGDAAEERRRQARLVDDFIHQWFIDSRDGTFKAGSHTFEHPAEFEEVLETHLRAKIIERLGGVPEMHGIRWHKGSPFRGLESFEIEHAQVFFGRTRARHELRQILTARLETGCPFLLIMGASGSGKSSLVKAGLLPDLQLIGMLPNFGKVYFAVMRPSESGGDPNMALASALLSTRALPKLPLALEKLAAIPPKELAQLVVSELQALSQAAELAKPWEARLVLVVDQLEELFAEAVTQEQRVLFVVKLETLVRSGIVVLATMRSDFFDKLETLPQLAALSEGIASTLLLPPNDAEIGQIIRQPAQEAGLTFEVCNGIPLDETIRMAAAAEPGVLPLLEFTLDQLWNRRTENGQLTVAAYDDLGGLKGAIGRRAEDIFLDLPTEVQAALPTVLFALARAEQGEKGRILANSTPLATFTVGSPERHLVDALLVPTARLLVANNKGDLRVAHEALLSHWTRARDLVESDRADLQLREKLLGLLVEWEKEAGYKRDSLLLQGGLPLSQAEDLLKRRRRELKAELVRYIEDSIAYNQRKIRRLKMAVVAFALLAIIACIGAWFGFTGQAAAIKRERQALLNESRFLAKTALDIAQTGIQERTSLIIEAALPKDLDKPERPVSPEALAALVRITEEDRLAGILYGHKGSINFASFSQHSNLIVTASDDNTARLWNLRSGAQLAVLSGHSDWVISAIFNQSGDRLLTSSYDNTARLWDTKKGALVKVLIGHTERILSSAFSPSGDRVITASFDATARLWDARSGELIKVLAGHKGPILSVAFDPSGSRVVTASFDKTVRIWNAKSGAALKVLIGHKHLVKSAVFSPSGDLVATASYDKTVRIWDAKSGTLIKVFTGHTDAVNDVAFSPSGDRVVSASYDMTARLWDAKSGTPLAVLKGHEDWVRTARFSHSGDRIITASYDKTARLWDAKSGEQVALFAGHDDRVLFADFSPLDDRVITVSYDKTARLWNTSKDTQIAVLKGHEDMVRSAAFNPTGDRAVTASADGTARLWDLRTGAQLAILAKHKDWVRSAVFSPSGDRVVTASGDNTARLWDVSTGKQLIVLAGHKGAVLSAVFNSSGDRILTASSDGTACVWNVKTGAQLVVFAGHKGTVETAAFSPSGTFVVTGSGDNTGRIWDAKKGTQLAVLKGHEGPVYSAVFDPSEKTVVTASQDKTARLWDVHTGDQLATFIGHNGTVLSATFSPSGDRVVTTSRDKTVRVWDSNTHAQLAVFTGHESAVHSAAFSASSDRIITSSEDKTARLWDMHLLTASNHDLLNYLQISRLRSLNDEERQKFFMPSAKAVVAKPFKKGGSKDPSVHRQIAERYERGDGVPVDMAKALYHHALAAQLYEVAGDIENAAYETARRGTLARNLPFSEAVKIWDELKAWRP